MAGGIEMTEISRKAANLIEEYFTQQKFNCAESTFMAGKTAFDLGKEVPLGLATGFGGSMGGCGSVCGAIVGSVMVAGLYFNRKSPEDEEIYKKVQAKTKEILHSFEDKFGSIYCKELTGYDLTDENQRQQFFDDPVRYKKCADYVASTVNVLVNLLEQDE